jgi:murein L,D-transpeptidase YcbB/YkuD
MILQAKRILAVTLTGTALLLAGPSISFADPLRDSYTRLEQSIGRDWVFIRSFSEPKAAEQVAAILATADRHGLIPADYHALPIATLLAEQKDAARLDQLLTEGLLRYISDVRVGRLSPQSFKAERHQLRPRTDIVPLFLAVAQAQTEQERQTTLEALPPAHAEYKGLVQALAALKVQQAQSTDWPKLPEGPKLEPNKSYPVIPLLRQRLGVVAPDTTTQKNDKLFDAALVEAVKAYQKANGLEPDGVVGAKTRASLNMSLQDRIDEVLVNMERVRWLPVDLGARRVVVNIPAQHLKVWDNHQVIMEMDTIIGRPARPTPSFSDNIRMLEFNPSWTVPPTIVREDILPHLYTDPTYPKLHKNVDIYKDGVMIDPATVDWKAVNVSSYRMKAPPGPQNPLGTVKFLFPNGFDVYLHDTSERDKFAKPDRALSSGCVRVAKPYELADWLMSNDRGSDPAQGGWTTQKRDEILASAKQTRLVLKQTVPVYLVYLTATWNDASQQPAFYADLYNRNEPMRAVLNGTGPSKLTPVANRLNNTLERFAKAQAAAEAEAQATTITDAEKAGP